MALKLTTRDQLGRLGDLLDALDAAGIRPPTGAKDAHGYALALEDALTPGPAPIVPTLELVADGVDVSKVTDAYVTAALRRQVLAGIDHRDRTRIINQAVASHVPACEALAPKVIAAINKPYQAAHETVAAWTANYPLDALDDLGALMVAAPDQAATIAEQAAATRAALDEIDRLYEDVAVRFGVTGLRGNYTLRDPDGLDLDTAQAIADTWHNTGRDDLLADHAEHLVPRLALPDDAASDQAWSTLDRRITAYNAQAEEKAAGWRPPATISVR